jgi:Xaa-Pro aminopeptidase
VTTLTTPTATPPAVTPFDDGAELALRHRRVRAAMAEQDLDLLLAYGPAWRRENIRYFTDVTPAGIASLVLVPPDGEVIAFSSRQDDLAAFTARGWVGDARPLPVHAPTALLAAIRAARPRRIGIAHHELVPLALMDAIRSATDAEIVGATPLLDTARLVKSDWELARMRRSAAVCAAGWEAFVEVLEPGLPEYRIVAEVEARIKHLGAEDNFMLIASGRDEVRGMTPPGDRRLEIGDMVRTELTPKMDGYWLQICRSAVVGRADEGQRASFALFDEAVAAGIACVRPGITAHEVAVAQNDVFRRHGYGQYCTSEYTRVRGHGHGLHLDETPIIEGNHTVLGENAVFIIHPNTYTPLAGYHVLGDPVRVTADGCEVLITTERVLFETGTVA